MNFFNRKILFFLVLTLAFAFCRHDKKNIQPFSLQKSHDSLYYLQIDSTLEQWELPYPVFQFQQGDVNGDGHVDALVGVIKTTRFDSLEAKRLFIFKNYKGYVRPLWLGSRMGKPLVDFMYLQTSEGPRIRTIEKDRNGENLVAEYKWRSFGLEFVKYLEKEEGRR